MMSQVEEIIEQADRSAMLSQESTVAADNAISRAREVADDVRELTRKSVDLATLEAAGLIRDATADTTEKLESTRRELVATANAVSAHMRTQVSLLNDHISIQLELVRRAAGDASATVDTDVDRLASAIRESSEAAEKAYRERLDVINKDVVTKALADGIERQMGAVLQELQKYAREVSSLSARVSTLQQHSLGQRVATNITDFYAAFLGPRLAPAGFWVTAATVIGMGIWAIAR